MRNIFSIEMVSHRCITIGNTDIISSIVVDGKIISQKIVIPDYDISDEDSYTGTLTYVILKDHIFYVLILKKTRNSEIESTSVYKIDGTETTKLDISVLADRIHNSIDPDKFYLSNSYKSQLYTYWISSSKIEEESIPDSRFGLYFITDERYILPAARPYDVLDIYDRKTKTLSSRPHIFSPVIGSYKNYFFTRDYRRVTVYEIDPDLNFHYITNFYFNFSNGNLWFSNDGRYLYCRYNYRVNRLDLISKICIEVDDKVDIPDDSNLVISGFWVDLIRKDLIVDYGYRSNYQEIVDNYVAIAILYRHHPSIVRDVLRGVLEQSMKINNPRKQNLLFDFIEKKDSTKEEFLTLLDRLAQ